MRKIIPEAKFVTILRDPLAAFESSYVYMGLQKLLKVDLNGFARKFAAKGRSSTRKANVGRNNLLWDLGMEREETGNATLVEEKIRQVGEQFDLVMITERFDESMVLLADLLCWPLEDVLYIRQNERLDKLRNVLTDETRDIMTKWLEGDYKVREREREKYQFVGFF